MKENQNDMKKGNPSRINPNIKVIPPNPDTVKDRVKYEMYLSELYQELQSINSKRPSLMYKIENFKELRDDLNARIEALETELYVMDTRKAEIAAELQANGRFAF